MNNRFCLVTNFVSWDHAFFWPRPFFWFCAPMHTMVKIVNSLILDNIGMQGVLSQVFWPKKTIAALYFGLGCCETWFFGHICLFMAHAEWQNCKKFVLCKYNHVGRRVSFPMFFYPKNRLQPFILSKYKAKPDFRPYLPYYGPPRHGQNYKIFVFSQ